MSATKLKPYKYNRMKYTFSRLSTLLLFALFLSWFGAPAVVNAYPVPELPQDNLLVNPWFRDANDPGKAGLDGWTRVLTDGFGWGVSQKDSNPAPDIVISGRCANRPVYCGTSARWARQFGGGGLVPAPNIDAYLRQVVSADPDQRRLKFSTYWVSHIVEVAQVSIYGSHTADGPWTLVWVPFFHSQDELIVPPSRDVTDLWEETGLLQATLDQGYSYYQVELHARVPDDDSVTGFKLTGIYFATEFTEEPADPTAAPAPTPTAMPPATLVGSDPIDPTPRLPADVTSLTARAVSSSQIRLSWSESENNSRGFIVERSATGTGDWVRIARVGAKDTAYSDPQLDPNTTQYYRLRISGKETSNLASARTFNLFGSPAASGSATPASQVAAGQDQATTVHEVTGHEVTSVERTPVAQASSPGSAAPPALDPSPLRLLAAVFIGAAVIAAFIAWRARRSERTHP